MTRHSSPPTSLRDLVPAAVAIGAMPPKVSFQKLPPAERALVLHAVAKRQREFATGRVLARRLLRDIGLSNFSIGRREDRTPIWPPGIIGSISHCDDMCVVAIAPEDAGIRSVGIDVEPAEPLPREIWEVIASHDELRGLGGANCDMGLAIRRLFSAKEAFYKCIYPLVQSLGFHDVELGLSYGVGREATSFRVLRMPFECARFHDSFEGRQIVWRSWIVSTFLWNCSTEL